MRYLFFGSKTHMLKRMFGDKERPFYKSATTMRLDKPPAAESADFVRRRFVSRSVGIDGGMSERIVREICAQAPAHGQYGNECTHICSKAHTMTEIFGKFLVLSQSWGWNPVSEVSCIGVSPS